MLLPFQGEGGWWVYVTQGDALGYELLPLRGALLSKFVCS